MVRSIILIKKITPEKILKFCVNKDITKNSLSFQLRSVSGKQPKRKDKKIYNLFLTKIGETRKRGKWQNQHKR